MMPRTTMVMRKVNR